MQCAVIFLTLVVAFTLTAGPALGQFSRGGGRGVAGSPGGTRQQGGSFGSAGQGSQGHQGRSFSTRGGETQIIIQQRPPPPDRRRGTVSGGFVSPSAGRLPPWSMAKDPAHKFSRFPDRRHHPLPPGILIIEVPRFDDITITTQIVSGGGWVDQPMARPYSAGIPGQGPNQLAPFDPTPQEVVERILALAGVQPGDVVYDLGSGDGRVAVTAAKAYGAKAVSFEVDPGLVKLARENARQQGVEKLVEIRQEGYLAADLSRATVVTLYLSYDGNLAMRPKLMRELKPGARVVSYFFDMGDWPAKIVEAYRDASGETHILHLWQISESTLGSGGTAEIPR